MSEEGSNYDEPRHKLKLSPYNWCKFDGTMVDIMQMCHPVPLW